VIKDSCQSKKKLIPDIDRCSSYYSAWCDSLIHLPAMSDVNASPPVLTTCTRLWWRCHHGGSSSVYSLYPVGPRRLTRLSMGRGRAYSSTSSKTSHPPSYRHSLNLPLLARCPRHPQRQHHLPTSGSLLKKLSRHTKELQTRLTFHPFSNQFQACDSPSAVLTYFKTRSTSSSISDGDERLKVLHPTISVLYAFFCQLGEGVGLG